MLWGFFQFIGLAFELELTIGIAVLLQASLATFFSYLRRLPVWWLLIQFCFPIALLATLALELPPAIFLFVFLGLLAVFWSLFKTRVPLYLSGREVWGNVAGLLPANKSIRFVDVGSGLGGLLFHLERSRPEIRLTGIELSPVPWLISYVRTRLSQSEIKFILGDYEKLDFSEFDVIFAFLSPVVMEELWRKLDKEMRPGSLFLSLAFPIPGKEPDFVIQAEQDRAVIYGYYA